MKIGKKNGFTLIEVIVVAGIIAILAGILVPLIFKEIDESKISRAAADIRSISSSMIVFRKDIGVWPVRDAGCSPNVTFLSGAGELPSGVSEAGYNTEADSSYDTHFATDANECYSPNWKGPYMAQVTADPWGNRYITNANNFPTEGLPVWIISAGPNGKLDTPSNSLTVQPDDIGLRMK